VWDVDQTELMVKHPLRRNMARGGGAGGGRARGGGGATTEGFTGDACLNVTTILQK